MKLLSRITALSLGFVCAVTTVLAAEIAIPDGATLAAALGDQDAATKSTVYIVRLADDPLVSYDGSLKGYAATKPAKNKKFNPNSGAVKRYQKYLQDRHSAALSAVGGTEFVYNYTVAYNGFAAVLTGKQAAALRKQAGVIAVVEDELLQRDTISTSSMLGLESGIWN